MQNATPGELAWFLRNRNLAKGMPSWSGIPEERRRQIVTYLKTLGVGATAEDGTALPSANNQLSEHSHALSVSSVHQAA